MRAIDLEYRALYGDPHDPVRAQMYRALVHAAAFLKIELAGDAIDSDNGRAILHTIEKAIKAEQDRP